MAEPPKNRRTEKRPGKSRVEQQLLAIVRGPKRSNIFRTENTRVSLSFVRKRSKPKVFLISNSYSSILIEYFLISKKSYMSPGWCGLVD